MNDMNSPPPPFSLRCLLGITAEEMRIEKIAQRQGKLQKKRKKHEEDYENEDHDKYTQMREEILDGTLLLRALAAVGDSQDCVWFACGF